MQERQKLAFDQWISMCEKRAELHERYAAYYNCVLSALSVPTIVAPICAGNLSSLGPEWTAALNLLGAVGSAIIVFKNYGSKTSQHSDYANRYSLLAKEIQLETLKAKTDSAIALQICLEKWFALELVAPHVDENF